MTAVAGADAVRAAALDRVRAQVARRVIAGDAFFVVNAHAIAACAAAMADRFFDGATLLVFGEGAYATDAQHNSVEYVHPVLPGCRALPALSLTNDVATVTGELAGADADDVYERQVPLLGRAGDIVLTLATLPLHPSLARGLAAARRHRMLTVALTTGPGAAGVSADHHLHVDDQDAILAQELHLATYHMLWELVHIVLNHRGIAEARR